MICTAKQPSKHPPGGFFYIIPFDNQRIEDFNLKELLASVAAYYDYKVQPKPESIENDVICQICERTPAWCIQESEGLGDTIHKVAQRTGVARMVAKVTGQKLTGCRSCGKRQKNLNQRVPYGRNRVL